MATYVGTAGDDGDSGTDAADVSYGLGGADILKGAGGNDRLYGGDGDDVLGENPEFTGDDEAGDDYLNGGDGNDYANGGSGSDKVEGGTGEDTVIGGIGKDYLWGGADADTFGFAEFGKENADKIMDWEKIDQIALEVDAFPKLKFDADGILKKKYFHVGKEAEDKKDKLVYNQDKGKLYYDPTGSKKGKSDMELIAKFDKGTKIKYNDIESYDFDIVA